MCKPKCHGGLGVKNFEMFTISQLAKWRWRFLSALEALWADLFRKRYDDLTTWSIFSDNFGTCTLKKCYLWWRDICSNGGCIVWRRLLVSRPSMKKDKRCCSTDYWLHNWTSTTSFKSRYPDLYNLSNTRLGRVANMSERFDDGCVWRWKWERALTTAKKDLTIRSVCCWFQTLGRSLGSLVLGTQSSGRFYS